MTEPIPGGTTVEGASEGPYGLGPYGDVVEHTGPPDVILAPDYFRPFFATDARSILVTILPNHYNFIPNPAFRNDTTGWEITGFTPAALSESWSFDSSTAATNTSRLNAITNGTADPNVSPDPGTAPAKEDGQLVLVSVTGVEVWLIIDSAATLTVAQASAAGLSISADVAGYRVWDASDTVLEVESWVGQSFPCNGTGMFRYRAGANKFVYVGDLPGVTPNQTDVRRGGSEYTFSVYAKGSGRVRLTMDAYYPDDVNDLNSGPEYQNLTTVADPTTEPAGDAAVIGPEGRVWTLIDPTPASAPYYEDRGRPPAFASVVGPWIDIPDDGDWHRVVIRTRARVPEGNGQVTFIGGRWIDTQIDVADASALLVSAVMLDSTEYPECAYFDGGITEDTNLDDFLWEGNADASVSIYYYDRLVRTQWLCRRLPQVIPTGRPYQIFFGSYWRPFVCETGETMMMTVPPTPQGP